MKTLEQRIFALEQQVAHLTKAAVAAAAAVEISRITIAEPPIKIHFEPVHRPQEDEKNV